MNPVSSACLFFWFSFLIVLSGTADLAEAKPNECKQVLSLESFRAYVLRNSPLLAEIDQAYAEELGAAFEAETLPNPELQLEKTFTRMGLAGANDPQTQINLGQPFRISNFGSRKRLAKLMRDSGNSHQRASLLELVQKLTLQYETLASYQQIEHLFRRAAAEVGQKVTLIKEGINKGLFSDGDHYLLEGEQYRLEAKAKNIAATVEAIQSELSYAAGYQCAIRAKMSHKRPIDLSVRELMQRAKNSPISEVARLTILKDIAEEQVRLAELDKYPQITPRLIYQHTNDGGDFFGAGFSIPLPVWNQNQGDQYRARAAKKVAEVKSIYLKTGGLESQITSLRNAIIRCQEQEKLYQEKVIPAFKNAFAAQESLYARGRGSVLQIWQSLIILNEARTEALKLSLEGAAHRLQLSILIGEEL